MRTLFIGLLLASASFAQERTWTITTAVVTAEAELIGVRGDVVYLKVGDKIESVPLSRLSVADHEYLASVSLAPVRRGSGAGDFDLVPPTGQGTGIPTFPPSEQPAITEEAIPLPTNAGQPVTTAGQSAGTSSTRGNNAGPAARRGGAQAATAASTATSAQRRGATTTTARRQVTPPANQLQSGQRGNANSDEPSGILGIRDRRSGRQRGR